MLYEPGCELARDLANQRAPFCERIEIAGGLRRRKPDVHDLELVAVPRLIPQTDLLGHVFGEHNLLDEHLTYLVEIGRLQPGSKNGQRYKQFKVPPTGIALDLFIVLPPAQWGVIFAIRTGPAHFSHWLVSHQLYGGALPNHLRVKDGAVWSIYGNEPYETPTEERFFEQLGLPWIDPVDRSTWGRSATLASVPDATSA